MCWSVAGRRHLCGWGHRCRLGFTASPPKSPHRLPGCIASTRFMRTPPEAACAHRNSRLAPRGQPFPTEPSGMPGPGRTGGGREAASLELWSMRDSAALDCGAAYRAAVRRDAAGRGLDREPARTSSYHRPTDVLGPDRADTGKGSPVQATISTACCTALDERTAAARCERTLDDVEPRIRPTRDPSECGGTESEQTERECPVCRIAKRIGHLQRRGVARLGGVRRRMAGPGPLPDLVDAA